MEILRTVCLAVVAAGATSQSLPRPEVVAVTAVIDGQTIVVSGHGRVRLAGISAPAVARGVRPGAAYGRQAKERLEGIVIQRFVRLEFDAGGRRAFVLLEDGTCVNATLVREGLARVETARGTRTACSAAELNAAEAQARAMRRGIWST
jgi:endonuclease YncB( thermonuclease family)